MKGKKRARSPHEQKNTQSMKILNGYLVPLGCESMALSLATQNPHSRDLAISFDREPHRYYVKGQAGYVSVSTIVHEYFTPFDSITQATKMTQRSDFKTSPRYLQYQPIYSQELSDERLVELIVSRWQEHGKEQAELGTKLHHYIEQHANGLVVEEGDISPEQGLYHAYYKKQQARGMIPYRTEWMLWDEDLRVAGCIDMIYYNPVTQTYHMVDWKRSREIKKTGFGRFGQNECAHLPDCNYSHYSLQLNMYKYLLAKHYDIVIADMCIVVLHPNNTEALELPIKDMQNLVHTMLTSRLTTHRSLTRDQTEYRRPVEHRLPAPFLI